jgi:hypothetical protein
MIHRWPAEKFPSNVSSNIVDILYGRFLVLFCFAWLALYTLSSLLSRLAFRIIRSLLPSIFTTERPVCVSLVSRLFRRTMTRRYRCNPEAAMTSASSTLEAACLCSLP